MTNKEYRAHEEISKSSLQEIDKSPLHFRYKMDHPQTDTPALLFGRAVHKFVLEESDFQPAENQDEHLESYLQEYLEFWECAQKC